MPFDRINPPSSNQPDRPYSSIRRQLLILGLFPLSEAVAWTTVFPYIFSMIRSFPSSTPEDKNPAVYAGIMVSVFTFGEFIMAPQWAIISDRIGRKPTLIIGSIGAVFSAIVFGFSTSLPWAIGARTCAGLLNPNLGVIQTFVGELVPKEYQARGFSVVPFLRSFGTIIGPVIGGYLAEPVQKYPTFFSSNTVWDRYPYLLPNLIVTGFLLSSCIIGLFGLDEVHPRFQGRFDFGKVIGNVTSNILSSLPWKRHDPNYSTLATDEPIVEVAQVIPGLEEDQPITPAELPAFSRQVILQILSSAILGFLKIAILAIVPIFLATPPVSTGTSVSDDSGSEQGIMSITGGFGFDTTSTSNMLLSQAIVTIISQIFAIPTIISRFGPLQSYRATLIVLPFAFLAMPLSASFTPGIGLPTILISLWIYALASGLATTCGAILITNTAPSPKHLAKINGAAASFGCLARTLGPVISGPLFRLGLRVGNVGLPFWSLSAVTAVGFGLSFLLRDHP